MPAYQALPAQAAATIAVCMSCARRPHSEQGSGHVHVARRAELDAGRSEKSQDTPIPTTRLVDMVATLVTSKALRQALSKSDDAASVSGRRTAPSAEERSQMLACPDHLPVPSSSTHAVDTLGFEPRAFRMRSGCDATTPCAPAGNDRASRLTCQGCRICRVALQLCLHHTSVQ